MDTIKLIAQRINDGEIVNSLELSFSAETDIWGWAEQLRTILLWETFHPDTVRNILRTEDDEDFEKSIGGNE